ncbi:MAG TPA: hypothetical protein VD789_06210 [Thermomicrobiales bacterium]|nr:hypothetical protein [Thermomicrobiales bacterium]
MSTTLFQYHQSAAIDLHVYGLAGIELDRRNERREVTRRRDLIASIPRTPDEVSTVRQWIGDAMIRIGTGIAGEAARAPRVAPESHPCIDMA